MEVWFRESWGGYCCCGRECDGGSKGKGWKECMRNDGVWLLGAVFLGDGKRDEARRGLRERSRELSWQVWWAVETRRSEGGRG